MSLVDRDRARGLIYGLALGDALGWPVEFMELPQILSKYGRGGICEPPDSLYTDLFFNTQMSAAVAEALIEAGQHDLDVLMGAVARNFIGWKRDPITRTRAPGATSIRGGQRARARRPWRESGVRDSKGCGACMRVAPVGYLYQGDTGRLQNVARAQGTLTHRHPTADAARTGAAYLVVAPPTNVDAAEYPERLLRFAGGHAPEFDNAIERVGAVWAWPMVDCRPCAAIGPTRGGA